ncbi:hypothetical protein BSKO_12733 [Bryopsis sp. KO-2023]|nr:hypothetical protein BSKO_12733 [Bryopsis sp. KO-2023]
MAPSMICVVAIVGFLIAIGVEGRPSGGGSIQVNKGITNADFISIRRLLVKKNTSIEKETQENSTEALENEEYGQDMLSLQSCNEVCAKCGSNKSACIGVCEQAGVEFTSNLIFECCTDYNCSGEDVCRADADTGFITCVEVE